MKRLLMMIQFMTIIPLPLKGEPEERDFAGGVIYMPLVGILVGALIATVNFGASKLFTPLISATLTIIAAVIITGGLHLDGLADTFDGLFSHRSREKMLEIMKDSRLGTMGALALILVLFIKILSLGDISYAERLRALLIVPVIGRMTVSWAAGLTQYARPEGGMGGAMINHTGRKEILVSTLLTAVIVLGLMGFRGIVPLLSAILFSTIFALSVARRLGGATGDTLGCTIELSEALVLLMIILQDRLFPVQGGD
jgi:adenosylcobinamide-GDP ribazoletransferase